MGRIIIKNEKQIAKIREVSKLAIRTLEGVVDLIKPGVTTLALDQWCHNYIVKELGAVPAPLGYHGYPKSICTSVNEEICHGIPSSKVKLKEGDIVNVDITLQKDGYFSDTSKMFIIGHCSAKAKHLVEATKKALYLAIKVVKPGVPLRMIGKVIQDYVDPLGYSIVREYCGHGVGIHFHEEPNVLHYSCKSEVILQPGMIFTIEPMINEGSYLTKELKNHWTVVTVDGKLSAQWEHTILVTETGFEVLTLRDEEKAEFQKV